MAADHKFSSPAEASCQSPQTVSSDKTFSDRTFSVNEENIPLQQRQNNPLSRILFLWICPLIRRGHKRPLHGNDIAPSSGNSDTASNASILQDALRERNGDLRRALFSAFGKSFVVTILLQVLGHAAMIVSAFLLRFVVQYAIAISRGHHEERWKGLAYVFAILLLQLASSSLVIHAEHQAVGTGSNARAAVNVLLFRKSMTISSRARHRNSWDTAATMNLITIQSGNLFVFANQFHDFHAQLFGIILAIGLMSVNMLYSPIIGFGIMAVIYPFSVTLLGGLMFRIRERALTVTKRRATILLQALSGMKFVKYFNWESMFIGDIDHIRKTEIRHYRHMHAVNMGDFAMSQILLGLVPLLIFASWKYTGHEFEPSRIFSTLAILNTIRMNLVELSYNRGALGQINLAIQQIERFLGEEDITQPFQGEPKTLRLFNASFTWEATEECLPFQLRDVNITFCQGLTAIIGPVGCGKSSLLMAIMGEMTRISGHVALPPRSICCHQSPWIHSASFRENILFGLPFDHRWYLEVLEACDLHIDIISLKDGDQTQIGERGVNLSGGQKQRISLARAIYSKPEVLLIDDVSFISISTLNAPQA